MSELEERIREYQALRDIMAGWLRPDSLTIARLDRTITRLLAQLVRGY